MRVILAAGGSGGHIFPSIALSTELEKAGVKDIFFISSKRRLDKNILKNNRHLCFFLSENPMPRKGSFVRLAGFAAKLFMDIMMSLYLIVKLRPDVVVGFGGYASGAISVIARMFGVPLLIHEQNLLPGRANKILSRIADRVAISFKDSGEYISCPSRKIVYTGNPLRLDMLSNDREKSAESLGISPKKLTVLIMGGSQGASFLNNVASGAALFITEQKTEEVQFIHLTGRTECEKVKHFYKKNRIPGKVFSFLERIEDAYAVSDLAVSRAGAAAIYELAFYAKPMILVPYPNPKNNQRDNAAYFARAGAAICREEKDLSPNDLAEEILKVLMDDGHRESISLAAAGLSMPSAGKRLAGEVINLGRESAKRVVISE